MLSVQSAQQKLQVDIISTYMQKIYQATTLLDLKTASRVMITDVTKLLFPGQEHAISSNVADPQDMQKEESKEKPALKEAMMMECDKFAEQRSQSEASLKTKIDKV